MKKIILVVLLMVGTIIVAQERNKRQQGERTPFTSEQKSQLMLKKMTLELDLNDSQQKEFKTIIAEKMAKRDAMKKEMQANKEKGVRPTSDERFAMSMKMLDEQIATKKRMEKILNPKQYEKWSSLKNDQQGKHKNNRQGKRGGKHPNNQGRKG